MRIPNPARAALAAAAAMTDSDMETNQPSSSMPAETMPPSEAMQVAPTAEIPTPREATIDQLASMSIGGTRGSVENP